MTMYTFCPNCHTLFRVSSIQLARAAGRSRCGECHQPYMAADYLFEDLAAARAAQDLSRQQKEDQVSAAAQEPPADSPAVSAADDHEAPPLPMRAGNWSQHSFKLPDLLSGAVIVFLVLLLGTQWVFFNRNDLAGNQDWRPRMEQFCKYLHCTLPLQVDLARLELLNRDVRQHPMVEEALLVNATLSNRADFIQPFPVLEVSFSDLRGNPVAMRRFRPNEYVNDSEAIKQGMLPGEPVPVVLEIQDPGEKAASYQFGFL